MEEFETESCIFCTNCFDRKPDINCEGGEALEYFNGGFNLFCKLLGVNVNCDGRSQPCCEECLEALRNLVKLDKIIVETRERQTEVVQLLRAVTVASATESERLERSWAQLREDLVKALQRLETETDIKYIDESSSSNHVDDNYMDAFEEAGDYSRFDVHDGDKQTLPEIKNCRVSLTRISLPSKSEAGIHLDQNDSITAGRIKTERRLKRKRVSKTRKKLIGIECGPSHSESSNFEESEINVYHTKRIKYVPSGLELPDSEEKGDQPSQFEVKNFYNSNVTEVFIKRKPGRSMELPGFSEKRHCYQAKSDDLFLRLRDDMFFHKNMLVAFTQNRLVCQEENCNYRTSCENTCVTFELFEEFRKHVNQSHKLISRHLTQTCPLCSKTFYKQRSMFKNHLIEEHSPPMICNSCWQPFYGKGIGFMMNHVWSHKNEEEKEFAKSLGYTTEKERVKRKEVSGKRKHQDPSEMNIFCDQCPRRFATEGGLKNHQKTHLQEKLGMDKTETDFRKFECQICFQQFPIGNRGKQQFERHMKSHSDDLSFICEICGKGFVSQVKLNVHANVHSEEPQFPCEFCGRKYKHPRNLHIHKQKAHGEMLEVGKGKRKEFIGPKIAFPCEFCDRIFPFRGPWANHVRKEHADKQGNEVNVQVPKIDC